MEDVIVSYCPPNFVGTKSTFTNLATLFNVRHFDSPSQLLDSVKASPRLALLGAYQDFYPQLVLQLKARGVTTAVIWTSSPSQMDLSVQLIELQQINSLVKMVQNNYLDHLLIGSKTMAPLYMKMDKKIKWFPYPIDYKHISKQKKEVTKENWVGLFLPYESRKNIVAQFMAVRMLQLEDPSLLFITNNIEQPDQFGFAAYSSYAKDIHLSYKAVGWQTDNLYRETVQKCMVSLNVTHAESLNFNAIKNILWGTPAILSPCHEWTTHGIVKNPDNPIEIANMIRYAIDENKLVELQTRDVIDFAVDNNKLCGELLNGL